MKKLLSAVLILTMMMSLFVMSPVSADDAAFELISYSTKSGSMEDGSFTVSGSNLVTNEDGSLTVGGSNFKLDLSDEMTAKTKTGVTVIEMKFTVQEVADAQFDYLYPVLGESSWNAYQPVMRTLATTHGTYPSAIQFFGSKRSDSDFAYTNGTMSGAKVMLKLFLDAVNNCATVHCDITDVAGNSQSFVSSPSESLATVYPIAEKGIDFLRVCPPTGSVVDYVKVDIAQNASGKLYYRLGALPFVSGSITAAYNASKVKSVLTSLAETGNFEFGSFVSDSTALSDSVALELLNYVKDSPYADNTAMQKVYNGLVTPKINYPSQTESDGFTPRLLASSEITEDNKINVQHTFNEDGSVVLGGFDIAFDDTMVENSKSLVTVVETEFTYGTIDDNNGANGNHDRFLCLVNYPGTTTSNYQPILQTLMRADRTDAEKKIRGFGTNNQPQRKYLTAEELEGAHFKVKFVMDMPSDLMALYVDFTPYGSDVTERLYGYVDLTENSTYASFKTYGVNYIKMYPSADSVIDYFKIKMVENDSNSMYNALLSSGNADNAKVVLDTFASKGMFEYGLGADKVNFASDIAPALLGYVMDNTDATNAQIQSVYDSALSDAFKANGIKAIFGNVSCAESFTVGEFNVSADLRVLEAVSEETANLVVAQYVDSELVKLDFVPYSMQETGDLKMTGSITPEVADGYIKIFAVTSDSLTPIGATTVINPGK